MTISIFDAAAPEGDTTVAEQQVMAARVAFTREREERNKFVRDQRRCAELAARLQQQMPPGFRVLVVPEEK